MISIFCQKSNGGKIETIKDLNEIEDNESDRNHLKILAIKGRPQSLNHFNSNSLKPFNIGINNILNDNSTDRPYTSSAVTNQKLNEQRISAKKLQEVQEWLNEQIIKRNEIANNVRSEKKFVSLHHQFNNTLSNETEIIQEIETKLKFIDKAQLRKKEITYKNWRINVQEPIKREIYKATNCPSAINAKAMRDINYISYLRHINKYGCAYQDDFDPKDYDPLIKTCPSAKIYEKTLKNVNQRKLIEETQVLNSTLPLNQKNEKSSMPNITNDMTSRSDISWNKWLSQKFNAVESKIRIRSSKKCNPSRNDSKIDFNWHYGNNFYQVNNANNTNNTTNNTISKND